ncbi:helix-turn-helix transcriptional regulator [Oceanobacter sp. 3_MG-2023]|uniref:helix-turn-helix transcriptional regulator n=1 Tax=Oceanobacter sp. 3_MG-2023 TaxID=3062622 RepID=UPI0027332CAB|nr:helix-turn-helix transcriptional regulator [Oceanobacter sp. 3_MG-2023]MDP2505408.1 helix-turn-helix transcriptional regulator [Oceanobacter sp. 3_MG-2023]
MDVSTRIQERMQATGLKAVQIVKLTGATKGSVSQWVNGLSKPSGEKLLALAKALRCDPEWLLTGKNDQNIDIQEEPAQWIGGIETWDSRTELREDEVELPFFTDVQLAAGYGAAQVLENHGPKLRFAKSTLKRKGVDPAHAACVKVTGSSMEPVLPDGSTVGIDTAQKTVIDGKMYAIDHDGMLRIKSLYNVPGGGIRLKSYNSVEYPDETYQAADAKNIRIIGRVFWYSVLI